MDKLKQIEALVKSIDILKLQFEVLNSTLRTSFDAFSLLTAQLEELKASLKPEDFE